VFDYDREIDVVHSKSDFKALILQEVRLLKGEPIRSNKKSMFCTPQVQGRGNIITQANAFGVQKTKPRQLLPTMRKQNL
jgi:hypothetical protein